MRAREWTLVCFFLVFTSFLAAQPAANKKTSLFTVNLIDGSSILATSYIEKINVQTAYGKLSIPVEDVIKFNYENGKVSVVVVSKENPGWTIVGRMVDQEELICDTALGKLKSGRRL